MESATRREWIQATGTAAAALAAGFTATSRGYAANETIRVGCIGTGGRCRRLMQALATLPGVQIIAVCDVWEAHLEEGRKLAAPGARATRDYREILDQRDVDAVLIGTPDHWHVPMTIDACAAGKDVYVEKPLTHDLAEGSAVIAAVQRHPRIVQVGLQQRSMPHLIEAAQIVRSGQLGTIHKVHLSWNRNTPRATAALPAIDPQSVDWKRFLGSAPDQPFNPYRFRNWRWFWDFGGGIFTDLMVHWIDVVHWYLGLDHPAMAVSIGDHFQAQGLWETPDTVQTLLRYPDQKVQAYFEGTFVNARNAAMCEFMGSEGTLYVDRGRYEIHPERRSKLAARQHVVGEGTRGADFYSQPDGERLHLANWLECIRTRTPPACPVEEGVRAAAAAHLANRALRGGGVAHWEGEQAAR